MGAPLELAKLRLELRSLAAGGDALLAAQVEDLEQQLDVLEATAVDLSARLGRIENDGTALEQLQAAVQALVDRVRRLERQPRYVGGGSTESAPPFDLNQLPVADNQFAIEQLAVRQAGTWRRMTWDDFLALVGAPPPTGQRYADAYADNYTVYE